MPGLKPVWPFMTRVSRYANPDCCYLQDSYAKNLDPETDHLSRR